MTGPVLRSDARPAGTWPVLLPKTSFRTRLLLALVGSVGLLGAASLLVVDHQRERQVEWTVQRTAERAQRAFSELERFRRAGLEPVARRVTGSIRIAAALDAAIDDGTTEEFVEEVRYELALAELEKGLVAFNDSTGRPVVTLVDGAPIAAGQADHGLFAKAIAGSGGIATGYRLVEQRLFAVQGHRLELFGDPVGTLTLGFAVDDDLAARLGAIVGSEMCFVAAGRCVAGTPAARDPALAASILAAARNDAPLYTTHEGRRLALVSSPLSSDADAAGIIAVPLEEVLVPFDRIAFVERTAAAAALLVAVLLGLVLSSALTAPIRTLVGATERVRRGDYEFSVDLAHRDEFGRLASAFNQMLAGLRLKERYRGVLDKVVSARVAEELMKGELRLGGETRDVTTLFADVRGFTALTEHSAPEQVIAMLNEWLELAAGAIEDEGGVVDKYVGDQVMAIFGAPIAQEDHAARAVRAAVRLCELTEGLNRERGMRGDQPFAVGIGINTGPAVAGNTGSSRRLNYTVLGASVNIAARLCAEAQPGELLISEQTYAHVADHVKATPQAPRMLKGFSRPMVNYVVHRWGLVVATVSLSLSAATIAHAQPFDLPTLSELGVEYVSPSGVVQVRPSLRIDLDVYMPQDEPAWHLDATRAFVAGRGSLFVDLFVGRRVFASTELRVDRGQPARAGSLAAHVQQAFVRLTPKPGTKFHVEVGKFITPFGNYPRRAHTSADPFIRPPLPYDYRTVISPDVVPDELDGIFDWKDRPLFRSGGLPIVWGVPYPIGATVAAGGRGWRIVAGVTNTTPSAVPDDWNSLTFDAPAGPSFVGQVSYRVVPELQLGSSYQRGAYMRPEVRDKDGQLSIKRQEQETLAFEAAFTRGHLDLRAELLINRWEVFRATSAPRDVSYYAEIRTTLAAGLFAAARYSAIRFRDLARSTGIIDRWDYDIRRLQLGSGYRLGRSTEIRAEYMINRTLDRTDPDDNLLSLQWWWTF